MFSYEIFLFMHSSDGEEEKKVLFAVCAEQQFKTKINTQCIGGLESIKSSEERHI